MSYDFDVAIAGGGPAGATAGIFLARSGWRVAIFEAGAFDRDKAGETLPPEINPLLRDLGLWELFRDQSPLECPGVISAWGGRIDEVDFTFNPFGPGWHIDRRRFDEMLFEAALREGAQFFSRQRVNFVRHPGRWCVERSAGPEVFARFVIDATGRGGLRIDGDRERMDDDALLATVVRFSLPTTRNRDLRTLIEAAPSGWWYSACLPANQLIAMFFTDRETFRRGDDFVCEQLHQAPLTRARLQQEPAVHTSTRVAAVSSSCRRRIAGDGWLCAGDSASSFDPLSGRGIFKAIRQSIAAARAAESALRGNAGMLDDYAATVRSEFDAYVVQKSAFYRDQPAWADRPFWNAKRASIGANSSESQRHNFTFRGPDRATL